MATLATQGLDVSIAGHRVCLGLTLNIGRGSRWAILGKNGAGKTTLLKTLAGLHRPERGAVTVDGTPLVALPRRTRARLLGVLFQEPGELFPGTVLETALIGRHPHLGGWHWEGERDTALATAALERMGLAEMAGRRITTLSGGERQRLAIAMLLTQDPSIFLLDEPTNHLDLHHQIHALTILDRLAAAGRTVVMVLHDVNLAARFCDHALLLYGDGAARQGRIDEVLNVANLERLYGQAVAAVETDWGTAYLPR